MLYSFNTIHRMQFRFGNTWGDVLGATETEYPMEEKLFSDNEKITGVKVRAGNILDGIKIYHNIGK